MRWVAALGLGATGCSEGASAPSLDPPGASETGDADEAEGSTGAENDGDCVSDQDFFAETVYAPILSPRCQTCHTPGGLAQDSSFVLRGPQWGSDYLQQNLGVFAGLAKLQFEGTPWVLLKPSGGVAHGGGTVVAEDGEEYEALAEMVARVEQPTECEGDGSSVEEFFAGVELLDAPATLRKATLSLGGRLPTPDEDRRARDDGFDGVDAVLDRVMDEDAFYDRLLEIYNDFFLTDRYYRDTAALDLLDSCDGTAGQACDYPSAFWFDELPEPARADAAYAANLGVAREPLQLVAHIVRNNLSYREILTADYTVVNPFSARTLGADVEFDDPEDPYEWRAAKIPGVPHAGVLTTTTFLARFPTTETNRNRHRSRILADFFLATNFQSLGTRPVDTSAIVGMNPTQNNEQCAICHATVDPIAGAFQNWDDLGRYRPPDGGWYPEMPEVGFGSATMPYEQTLTAARWLGQEVAQDTRFSRSAIRIVYRGLTGQEPLPDPYDPDAAGYLEAIRAKNVQNKVFDAMLEKFAATDYNLRTVVKEVVRSPYYRAANADKLDELRREELKDLGMGRLLTPEQLNRKIIATTGYPWSAGRDDPGYLLDPDVYALFYGGIDSDGVVDRITEPNGVMVNVATRMSSEVACRAVPQDFATASDERALFPHVDAATQPDSNAGADAIRTNLRYLAQRLWGEALGKDDPELERLFELYVAVWEDGLAGVARAEAEGGYPEQLSPPCRATRDFWTDDALPEDRTVVTDSTYTVRAWMSVLIYMLADYRFVVE